MDSDGRRLMMLYESMTKKPNVSKVVIVNDNKILLMQKNGTLKWELPGGHAEHKESGKKTACREVKEETGITLDKKFLTVIDNDDSKDSNVTWYLYNRPVKPKVKLSKEHVNYKWVGKAKLDKYSLSAATNHMVIISSYNQ